MIFSDALRSLKSDPSRTFFYFLTFFLTTMFMFLFFNLGAAEAAVSPEYIMNTREANIYLLMQNGNITNLMEGYVLILCCVDIIFANSFFIRNKAEELAVRLVCGATFTQLAFYLLIQTFLLLLVAIPLGIACAVALIPVVNNFMAANLANAFTVEISNEAIVNFSMIIFMLVGWTTTLNLSFAYQNEAAAILNGSAATREKPGDIITAIMAKINDKVKAVIGFGVVCYAIMKIFTSPAGSAGHALIAMVGLEFFLMYAVIPMMTHYIDHAGQKNPLNVIVSSFLREDLRMVRLCVYLFVGNAAVLAGMLTMRIDGDLAALMIMLTYVVMNVMQALALMFRLQTHLAERHEEYNVLAQVGYEPSEQKKILNKETNRFFLIVLVMALVLIGCMILSLARNNMIPAMYATIMITCMVVPLFCVWILSGFFYRRSARIQDMIHSIEESRR